MDTKKAEKRIGIDIGGTSIAMGIVSEKNVILAQIEESTHAEQGPDAVINRIKQMIQHLLKRENISLSETNAIGIGCPGELNRKKGVVLYSNNIQWEDVPIVKILKESFPIPIYLENDANCATLGEHRAGAGKAFSSMVMVTLGTGIGGGMILNNSLYTGAQGNASIIGHMAGYKQGEACNCGRTECWEQYASVGALLRKTKEMVPQFPSSIFNKESVEITGKSVMEAAKENDSLGTEVFTWYTQQVAQGIANIINCYDTEGIVIGGSISKQGEFLLAPIREIANELRYCRKTPPPVLVVATCGNNAGIIGAAGLVDN